jgi:hypothetical protein
MRDSCSSIKPLITEALFGSLSDADRQRLDAHVSECDACADELQSLRSTLEIASAVERPERPEAYWSQFSEEVYERAAAEPQPVAQPSVPHENPSLARRFAEWWDDLPELWPTNGAQWAVQLAVAVVLVAAGLGLGRWTAPTSPAGTDPLLDGLAEASTDPLLMPIGANVAGASAEPRLTGVEDITYDMTAGTVEIRYHTSNDIVVRGAPDDPKIQRLLQAALLDEQNPASRLHAVKTIEASTVSHGDELASALTYLVRDESDPNMRLRAVRALRQLQANNPLDEGTRGVLVGVLLDAEEPALRIEALEALTADATQRPTTAVPSFLYQAQADSNGYVRYRAGQLLEQLKTDSLSR